MILFDIPSHKFIFAISFHVVVRWVVRIIIPDSDDEQDNNNNPLPSEAAGPSKRQVS
jgi:hypothetical protein